MDLINRLWKLTSKGVEYCWAKMNPIIFVHSSDLMLPGEMGITAIQVIVISRLLDIESRRIRGVLLAYQNSWLAF